MSDVIYAARLVTPTSGAGIDPQWYVRHAAYQNLALLFAYLDSHGIEYGRPQDVLEKPWHYEPEFHAALAWREEELTR
jgi:hypothetical protein